MGKHQSILNLSDDRVIYLDAVSQLNPTNSADNYNWDSLNKIHKAVDHISKNGDLFYLNNTGHKELALDSVVPIFVKNINFFIIGTLIGGLIAFPAIVRHYTDQEKGQ